MGGAAAVGIGRRWLIALLAFLLGATLVAITTSPARALNYGPVVEIDQPTEGEVFGTGDQVDLSATFTGDGSETYNCLIDWGDDSSDEGSVLPPGIESEGTCTGSHTYEGTGSRTIEVTVTGDFEASGVDSVTIEIIDEGQTVIQCGEGEGGDPCANFEDPEGRWEASCEDCDGALITINEEEDFEVANIDVTNTPLDGFTLELIDREPPRFWWRTATVFVDGEEMDRCTLREVLRWVFRQERPAEGCFYLTPLFRPLRLKYTVLWPTDPGFSFR
jgi:hypothetical protein